MALENDRITLCWPNHTDSSTLTGGSWSTEFELDHLKSAVFAKAAHTTNAVLASTQFIMTFARYLPVGIVALANHNLSVTATWRIRLYFDTARAQIAYDSDWVNVWSSVYNTINLEWEYDNYWSGTLDQDDRERFTPVAYHLIDDVKVIQAALIEMNDTSNSDGYVSVGRAFVGDVWQAESEIIESAQFGYEIGTTFEAADNAETTEYADVKTPKRTVAFDYSILTLDEGVSRILSLQRTQGLDKEILYTENSLNTYVDFAKTFIGRLRQADPLQHPYFNTYQTTISLQEIL